MDFDIVSDLNSGESGDNGVATLDIQDTGATPADTGAAPADQTGTKPLSLRDQISSAIKAQTGDKTPTAAQQDGRPRNADGTFAAQAPEGGTPPANGTQAQAPAGTGAVASTVPVPAGIDPTVFNSLPAETQQSLARTMEGLNQQAARYAPLAEVEQLIAPRVQQWALNGMTPSSALNQLLALSDFAASDPGKFITWFAGQRGINLENIAFEQPQIDPERLALQQNLQQMQQRIAAFEQQQQQQAHTAVTNEVQAFIDEKGADGQPLRPYFAEMGNEVMPFVAMVRDANPSWTKQQILQEAYDRACWAIPAIRAKVQQAAVAAAEAARVQNEAALRAKQRTAGQASIPNTGVPAKPAQAKGVAPGASLRDTIKAAMAEQSA